jgi:hypothetical protein
MTEDEILARAREARIKVCGITSARRAAACRNGSMDTQSTGIRTAITALRDLSKPLSELQPADPDREEALRLAKKLKWSSEPKDVDNPSCAASAILVAIKRGRELQESGQ